MDDSCPHWVGGITEEITMRDLKTSKRRGPMSKAKSWLKRPGTFKMASFILNVINLAARVIDHFK
jgi:hypothetical protein